ncbi:MAG: HAMP domain-containing histidine kinase [Spirochaetia bacterium]|nr:HAMP domain-containing histidine kinase [Spirochaetia bacterium]
MKPYENRLFLRLTVTLAIIFFSILFMIFWWQLLFDRALDYHVAAEKRTLENKILKGIYAQPELIHELTSTNCIIISNRCISDVCVKIPLTSTFYEISPEYLKIIENDKIRKLHMFFSETYFLVVILLVTIGYMFWIVSREKKYQEDKQEFLVMTTHELKHPVSVISLLLESLKMNSLPKDRIGEFIDKGLLEIKTLKKSLENILKLQELNRTHKKTVSAYNFQEYIKSIIQNWKLHSLNKDDRLVFSVSDDNNFFCHIDQSDLQIILNNLIENALLYSTNSVFLELGKDTKGNYIQVKDSGLGFTDEDKLSYQKMFFRSGRHDIQNIGGSGLGHYIIKKLAAKHSINIMLESDGENKGSTFKVYVK